MRISGAIAKSRQARTSRVSPRSHGLNLGHGERNRSGTLNFAFLGDPRGRYDRRSQSIEEKIFYKMSMKPIPVAQLKKKKLDLDSGKTKLADPNIFNFPIDPELIQVREIQTQAGNSVRVLIVHQPDFNTSSANGTATAAVIVPGQHGNVVGAIESGEVTKHWRDGKNVILATVRGYHGNPGQLNHIGQASDLAAILNHISSNMKIKPENTSVYAHSMGCDTFINANALRTQQGLPHTYGLIELRAPYESMAKMIEHKIRTKWYLKPFRRQIPDVLEKLAKITLNSFDNLKHLSANRIRIITSPFDTKVRSAQSEAVSDEIHRLHPGTHLVFYKMPDYSYTDHDSVCFPTYAESLVKKSVVSSQYA